MLINEINEIKQIEDLFTIADKISKLKLSFIADEYEFKTNNGRILLKNYINSAILNKAIELNKDNPSLNLKNLFSKKLITKKYLFKICKQHHKIKRDFGNIPKIFFPESCDKKIIAKKLFNIFAHYSLILNYKFNDPDTEQIEVKCSAENLTQELKDLLKKNIEVKYLGSGQLGNTFLISVSGNENSKPQNFVYKIFYPHHEKKSRHGNIEVLFAYFANKNSRKSQFSKFIMGRIATPIEKDCFLITEYLQQNNKNNCKQRDYLDYLKSSSDRPDNFINGKSIDFGGLNENIPDMSDKRIRRIVNIILKHLQYSADITFLQYKWWMTKKQCSDLKHYICNNVNHKLYLQSLDVIRKNIPLIPNKLINNLKNINKWDNEHSINIELKLRTEDIITNKLYKIHRTIQKFNLTIKSQYQATDSMLGYIIVDLMENRNCIYKHNKDNNILSISIENINNEKQVLLEYNFNKTEKFNKDIKTILAPKTF